MTTRIEARFELLKKENRPALITFITAGDPDLGVTEQLIYEFERQGADIIELGMPFSDPSADGPTIQASSERALASGTTVTKVLRLVKKVRRKSQIPIVLFGYYNPIFARSPEAFAAEAKVAGADGVLVVDLPPEEAGELKPYLDQAGLNLIYLLAPTSTDERIRLVAERASGFVYYVQVTGVTGARKAMPADLGSNLARIRKHINLPVGVGFGVSSRKQAREIGRTAEAVVVGSAIVSRIAELGHRRSLVRETGKFVAELRKGIEESRK